MLNKILRLSRREDISKIIKTGKKFNSGAFYAKFSLNGRDVSRFGFVVPAKSFRKATQRNLLKRRARGVVLGHIHEIKKGYDILFVFSSEAKKNSYKELEDEILNFFRKIKLL